MHDDPRINLPPRSSRALQFVMLGGDERIRKELSDRDEQAPTAGHSVSGVSLDWLEPLSRAQRAGNEGA